MLITSLPWCSSIWSLYVVEQQWRWLTSHLVLFVPIRCMSKTEPIYHSFSILAEGAVVFTDLTHGYNCVVLLLLWSKSTLLRTLYSASILLYLRYVVSMTHSRLPSIHQNNGNTIGVRGLFRLFCNLPIKCLMFVPFCNPMLGISDPNWEVV